MDTNLWFPFNADYSFAKAICDRCAVATECLEMALQHTTDNYGMFGGMTPLDRDYIRSKRQHG